MRILMTTDTVGGVWTYALELVAALRNAGVEVALATMGLPLNPAQRDAVNGLGGLPVFESHYKLEWMDNPWKDVALAGEWLLDLEAQWVPDLVHLNSYMHGALPWRTPLLMVGHSCVLSWWEAVRGEPAPPNWHRYQEAVYAGLHGADCVVAPTQTMLAALDRHYGPLPEAQVIYNGRDARLFGAVGKGRLIFASGRVWDEAKNLAALEAVAPALAWPAYVAGEAEAPDGGYVHFRNVKHLGRLDALEMAAWFARASIYVHPARYEPFGLCVLEAALSGCAIVLGDIPSLRELWDGRALFVPPDDHDALQQAVTELIDNPTRRHELADVARCHALSFSPERMAKDYLKAYTQLLSKRLTPAAERAR